MKNSIRRLSLLTAWLVSAVVFPCLPQVILVGSHRLTRTFLSQWSMHANTHIHTQTRLYFFSTPPSLCKRWIYGHFWCWWKRPSNLIGSRCQVSCQSRPQVGRKWPEFKGENRNTGPKHVQFFLPNIKLCLVWNYASPPKKCPKSSLCFKIPRYSPNNYQK